ncbi:hypothetical protein EW146_g5294 [Bondarzewia mesenterica]|uniref:Peroxisomal targeting signal receptor n=1 Tax=Bondarzewia mesenterica TaxID=1095465 RepID=A0A4S4LT16_9AGAM|nr:hypothetical protein EW146_g5294 [Bondarzewia mesenterica]
MSLPMLVNGADCGPVNPLQGLTKRFDQDRGLQQVRREHIVVETDSHPHSRAHLKDYFGAGRAGPSRETFRTEQPTRPELAQDAARFFSGHTTSAPPSFAGPSAFDLTALHASLPGPSQAHARALALSSTQPPTAHASVPFASWAADFVVQSPAKASPAQMSSPQTHVQEQNHSMQRPEFGTSRMFLPSMSGFQMNQMTAMSPVHSPLLQQPAPTPLDQKLWDQEFRSLEASFLSTEAFQAAKQGQSHHPPQQVADELARTAGQLIDSVSHDQNPKFQNSQFMGLMRQLRDREMVVEGNDLVQNSLSEAGASQWADDFSTAARDVKGKGKAIDPGPSTSIPETSAHAPFPPLWYQSGAEARSSVTDGMPETTTEDANEAYFRQDNEEYAEYWRVAQPPPEEVLNQQKEEWAHMQRDWDAFEATATGVRPVSNYLFQPGNPYLLGERSADTLHHHLMHGGERPASFYESVLQMEAAVQREPTNARAWFELGVKQQENEREHQAIQALRRALELDPSHLPSWLALAISHTNEGDRHGTYASVREWVDRNERYQAAVAGHRAVAGEADSETNAGLIECLIAMARSEMSGGLDADIQIALAVLLNTNEDWLLYNRVGATMANNGQAEDAITYYYRALELNPAYIRARFNLGISCINLQVRQDFEITRYEEAAQHIFDALVLQDSDRVGETDNDRGITSTSLWESLKTTCLHMQRVDLAALCDQQNLEGTGNSIGSY